MNNITRTTVVQAIQAFLTEQLNKKLEPEIKVLEKAKVANDTEAIIEAQENINQLTDKYFLENWMEDAANRMAKQLKFGSHISKGVHPDAKGDNINFKEAPALPEHLIGSQTLADLELDANGNAAALPLASFFNTPIGEYKLRDLIQTEHSSLKGCFASDETLSDQYAEQFKTALDNVIETPSTSELNKQLLWPQSGAQSIEANDYLCLVPLYPSALTKHLHKTINGARFSEANKQARDNRKKKTAEQAPYISIHDLAYIQLGGTKPQNISQLTSSQGGRNFLLPSLPPQFTQKQGYTLSKQQKTYFNRSLQYSCNYGFSFLFSVIENNKNNVETREQRKEAMEIILSFVLGTAQNIQQTRIAGWSKDCNLPFHQKYWLDPERAELEEEETFREQKEQNNWHKEIEKDFALWINQILQKRFQKYADDFNDPEMREWRREISVAIKASQRKAQGIF